MTVRRNADLCRGACLEQTAAHASVWRLHLSGSQCPAGACPAPACTGSGVIRTRTSGEMGIGLLVKPGMSELPVAALFSARCLYGRACCGIYS